MASVTVNGNTYTDDASPTTGLANGGHRTRLVPMLSDAVTDLAAKQAAALASKNAAATSETNAAASAATAVNAPGTSATSTTSLAIGTGSKTLTIQTGKSIVVGMSLKIAYTTDPTKWMAGDVTAYNSGTGSLTVNVTLISSSGTFAAWTVSLAGATLASVLKSGDTMTGPLSVPAGASGTQVPQAQETLLKAGGTMTGAINEAAAVSIASSATVNIGAAAANSITITGTTTITAFDTIAAGARRRLTFAAALTLTHNATSLILPGAANITTAAGDSGEFLSLGGGNWRCVSWQKAAGTELLPRSARTGNTILAASDIAALIDVTSGTFTQTITAAATLGNGWWCWYRNSGTGVVTLDPNGAETINGAATATVSTGEVGILMCDGSALYLIKTTGVGDHEVTVHTGNGAGSTNTRIRRFTTTLRSVGAAITYADSAANGASFTINEPGLYECYYSEPGATNTTVGISLNSSQLSTNVDSINVADRLAMSQPGATAVIASVTRTVRLVAGDVIRPHFVSATGTTDKTFFSIRKVGT